MAIVEPAAASAMPFARGRPLASHLLHRLAIVLAVLAVVVGLLPLLAPYDPSATDFLDRLAPPSADHPLGTDQLGRDVLSRLLHGLRTTPTAAAVVVVLALAGGGGLGLLAGTAGGLIDGILMRLTDGLLTVPALAVALAISGVLGIRLTTVIVSLAIVHSAEYARLVRNAAMAERERMHVLAARALGAPPGWLVVHHIVPGLARPVLTLAAYSFSWALLAFAGLSFLGLGTPPGAAEWGAMIAEARSYMRAHPHLVMAPGLAIVAMVMAANLLGDWLGDRRARPSLLSLRPVRPRERRS